MDQENLNILAKGAVLTGVGIVLSKLLTYVFRASVARYAGPEAYGVFSLGLTVLGVIGTLSILAMNQAIKKYVADYREEEDFESVRGVILSVTQMTMPLSLLLSATMFLSAEFIAITIWESEALIPVLKVLAIVPPFANISKISISTTLAYKKVKYHVLTNQIFQNLVQVLTVIPLLLIGYGAMAAAGAWVAGYILSGIVAFYFMERSIGPILFSDSGAKLQRKKLLKYSYPLVFSGMIGTVLGWADTAFLGYFMQESSVGIYNAALPTAALIMIPYQLFSNLALPTLSEANTKGGKELSDLLKTLTRWTFYVSFPAFILMFLFSEQMLQLLFGSEYIGGAAALVILAFSNMFGSAVGHLDQVIKAISETNILLKNTLANLGLNILLNILLIPEFGLIGAAIATASSTVFVNTLLVLEVYHFKEIHPFSGQTLKPVISSIPGLMLVYLGLNLLFETVPLWSLVPGAIVFAAVYLVTLVLTGAIREQDREIIIRAGRKIGREELGEKIADLATR